jgi:thiol-disulfide isomerase/thioredoxin
VKSPLARVAVAVLLVAAAGPAGFLLYRALHAAHTPPEPAHAASTVGAPAPAPPTASAATPLPPEAARAAPERLPDISMPDTEGHTRALSEWRGHPLLVNFWATWCEPCRREIPLLERLRKQSGAASLEIVGIAVDTRAAVLPYARQMHIDYPLLIGEDDGIKAVDAFGMQAVFPFSVFADREGRIVALKIGELHPEDAQLILARLDDVDQGRLDLAAARQQISTGLAALEKTRRDQDASHPSGG